MPVLNTANALRLGTDPVGAVYLGAVKVWPGAQYTLRGVLANPTFDAAEGATSRYTLGTWFSVSASQTVLGVSVFNPGFVTFSPGGTRDIHLWRSDGASYPGGTGTAKVASKAIPDKLPVGWSDYYFTTPQTVTTATWWGVSYDVWPGGGSGANGDYAHLVDAFPSAVTVGAFRFETAAGKYHASNDTVPDENYLYPWYGVDIIRSTS